MAASRKKPTPQDLGAQLLFEQTELMSDSERDLLMRYENRKNDVIPQMPSAITPKVLEPEERLHIVGKYIKMYDRVKPLTSKEHMLRISGLEYLANVMPQTLDEHDKINSMIMEHIHPEPIMTEKILRFLASRSGSDWKYLFEHDADMKLQDEWAIRFLRRARGAAFEDRTARYGITKQKILEDHLAQERITEHDRIWHKAANTSGHFDKLQPDGKFGRYNLLSFIMDIQRADRKEVEYENAKMQTYPKNLTWRQINRGIILDKHNLNNIEKKPTYFELTKPEPWIYCARSEAIRRKIGYFKRPHMTHLILLGLYDDKHMVAMYDAPRALPYLVRVIVGKPQTAIEGFATQLRRIYSKPVLIGMDGNPDKILKY